MEALLTLLEGGLAWGGAVEELLALLERSFDLDAVALAIEGRAGARVRAKRAIRGRGWWSRLSPLWANELARRPLGSWCSWSRGPHSAAMVALGPPTRERVTLALFRGHEPFDANELRQLRWLAAPIERALSGDFARHALGARSHQTLQEVIQGSAASARISLRQRTIEWSPTARDLFDQRLGVTLASVAPMILRAAGGGGERVLPGGLRVAFVLRGAAREETLALFHDASAPPSSSSRALYLAEELLSLRQRQVARRIAAGDSLPEIAQALGIRHETARAHLSAAYDRLGVRDRARLALTLAEATLR
jgi:DNA-binding CsgD family transcriptional regulator